MKLLGIGVVAQPPEPRARVLNVPRPHIIGTDLEVLDLSEKGKPEDLDKDPWSKTRTNCKPKQHQTASARIKPGSTKATDSNQNNPKMFSLSKYHGLRRSLLSGQVVNSDEFTPTAVLSNFLVAKHGSQSDSRRRIKHPRGSLPKILKSWAFALNSRTKIYQDVMPLLLERIHSV